MDDPVFLPRTAWAPGTHVVVLTDLMALTQTAYDVDTRTFVDIPLEPGVTRSRTGLHRADYGNGNGCHSRNGGRADIDEE